MSVLSDVSVDPLPGGRVRITGLTSEPIECAGERLVALLSFCNTNAWKNVEEDEEPPQPLSDEFKRNLGE